MKIVVIDPRRTDDRRHRRPASGRSRPTGDVPLFTGLLAASCRAAARSTGTTSRAHTSGFDEALAAARRFDMVAAVAERPASPPSELAAFYDLFAAHRANVVTVYSQGVNQSSPGTDKVNAIINCHLATGRIGKPGAGPFSVTGQPNAMGGREVGGLANMLAAHMEIENADAPRSCAALLGLARRSRRSRA